MKPGLPSDAHTRMACLLLPEGQAYASPLPAVKCLKRGKDAHLYWATSATKRGRVHLIRGGIEMRPGDKSEARAIRRP